MWDALRDVGEVHRRVAPGFVKDCRMEGEARMVTFGNGFVAREVIVDVDDKARRLAGRCRLVWVADLLPHAAASVVGGMLEEGAAVMSKTLAGHSKAA